MVNPDELWVGEHLKHTKSGKKGVYEGIGKNGKIRVKRGTKIFLYPASSLEIIEVKEKKEWIFQDDFVEDQKEFDDYDSIDLHIEILAPTYKNAKPERILDMQINVFEHFLKAVIQNRNHSTQIIHGKGTGTLKAHIFSVLNTTKEVLSYHVTNDGGATDVFFNY